MKKVIFFGLLAFLLASLWLFPLRVVQPYVEKSIDGLNLGATSGTIWNGKTVNLRINNTALGETRWKIQPLQSLISFKLKTYFEIIGDEINAEGFAGITLNKQLSFDNTKFDISSDYINRMQNNAKLTGNITGNITKATLRKNEVPQIQGIVDWNDGALNSPIKLPPGNYKAIISPSSGDLTIKLSSNEAPIELSGDIKLIKDWSYDTNITAKSNESGIATILNLAGRKQSNGSILIKNQGNLSPLINR